MSCYRNASVAGVIIPASEFRQYGFEKENIREPFLEMVPVTPMYWEHAMENSTIGQWHYGRVVGDPGNQEIVVYGSVYAPAQVPLSRRAKQTKLIEDLNERRINGISVGMDCIVQDLADNESPYRHIVLKEISLCDRGLFPGSKILHQEASKNDEGLKKNQVTLIAPAYVTILESAMSTSSTQTHSEPSDNSFTDAPEPSSAAPPGPGLDQPARTISDASPRTPPEDSYPAKAKLTEEPASSDENVKRQRTGDDDPRLSELQKKHDALHAQFSAQNLQQLQQHLSGVDPKYASPEILAKLAGDPTEMGASVRSLVMALATQPPSNKKAPETPTNTWGPKVAASFTRSEEPKRPAPAPASQTVIPVAASSKSAAVNHIMKTLTSQSSRRMFGTDMAVALAGL
jgi:hypothetical protein